MTTLRFLACFGFLLSSVVAQAVEATYTAQLETLWNGTTHPNGFRSSAHFSPLIGATHSNNVSFWAPGQTATPGIEDVAELGSTTRFRNEISLAQGRETAVDRIEIPRNLFSGQSGVSNEFSVSQGYPLVTLATMIAPSSDWFIGVHDLDLRDGDGFVEELVFEFNHFYDAGTEEGNTFSLSNPATTPQGVITIVSGAEAAAPFHGAGVGTLAPIARLTLTRQSIIGVPGDFDGDGEVTLEDAAVWRSQYGQTGDSSADANGDGVVDAADYTVWRDALPSAATAVPEPSMAALGLTAVLGGLARRRPR